MADATNHTEKLQRAVEDLKGGQQKVRQVADAASGVLRGMGLSGVAEKVGPVMLTGVQQC